MSRVCQWSRLVRLLGAASVAVAAAGVAEAHEVGTTRVTARFTHEDTYTIEISADAGVLLARLETATHRPRFRSNTLADYQRGFDLLCREIPQRVALTFDGVRSIPQATCVVDPADASAPAGLSVPGVTATLRGKIPALAKTFAWQYALTFASYGLTLKAADSNATSAVEQTVWLEGDQESQALLIARAERPPSGLAVARTYFMVGFRHILPDGPDHVLFVLGIFFLSRRLQTMLLQVTAFTVAQSITLGLTLRGTIALPSVFVAPILGWSIVYVAIEHLYRPDRKPWPALGFGFGLLHGLALAAVWRGLALPQGELLTRWAAFNAGVEAGQLGVILGAFLIVGNWARQQEGYRRLVVLPGSAAIALIGLFWTMQRLAFQ